MCAIRIKLFFVTLLFSSISFSQAKVAVINNLENSEWLFGTVDSIVENNIESLSAINGIEVDIIHRIDQYQLYELLVSKEYQAIFWAGHGAAPQKTNGVGLPGVIIDINGHNIAPILKKYARDLAFLAIIGCESSWLELDDETIPVASFDDKITIRGGIKAALKQFKKDYTTKTCKTITKRNGQKRFTRSVCRYDAIDEKLIPIRRDREHYQIAFYFNVVVEAGLLDSNPFQIFLNRKLVGVVPAVSAGDSLEIAMPIFSRYIKSGKNKFLFSSNGIKSSPIGDTTVFANDEDLQFKYFSINGKKNLNGKQIIYFNY